MLRSTPLNGEQILWGKILGTLPLVTIPPLVLVLLLALLFGVRGWGLGAVAAMVLLAGGLTFTALPVVLAGRLLDNREASLL